MHTCIILWFVIMISWVCLGINAWKRGILLGLSNKPRPKVSKFNITVCHSAGILILLCSTTSSCCSSKHSLFTLRNRKPVLVVYTLVWWSYIQCLYIKISDSGPSEIGTCYLYKGHFSRSQIISLLIVLLHFEPLRRGQPLYKGHQAIFPQWIICSKVLL